MCLLDTGCDTTLFPYSLVKRIKGISVTESNKRVLAANNTEVTIIGEAATWKSEFEDVCTSLPRCRGGDVGH